MGGWDSVQGRVEAIRWRSAAGRRPWLASAMGPARLAPARVTVGKEREAGRRDKVWPLGPAWQRDNEWKVGRRLWWAERVDGLAVW
jgi:hypothetical protein